MNRLSWLRGLLGAILCLSTLVLAQTTLSGSESALAQKMGVDAATLTPEQLQQARSALGGRDPATLSPSEIMAAQQALANAQNKRTATQTASTDSLRALGLKAPSDSLEQDSLAMQDSLYWQAQPDSFQRYETRLFSRALPSAFYNRMGVLSADYPVKAGDQLVLSLWGAVEKEYSLKVNSQGKVFAEGIGLVSLNGMSLGQAEKLLRSKLLKVYSGIAQGRISVNLRPESVEPNKVFVMGDVERPGGYDLPGGSNVFMALYRAHGPNAIGSVRQIKIRRSNGDSLDIDLYELLFNGVQADQSTLRDGDLVFVPRAQKLVKIQGDVGRPAIYELKGDEGVQQALAYAGGVNSTAGHVLSVWRLQADGRAEVMDLGAPRDYTVGAKNEPLFDQDSLVVRSSSLESQQFVELIGAVHYPGLYRFEPGLSVRQAVDLAGGLREDGYTERVVVRRPRPDSSFLYLADRYTNPQGLELRAKDRLIVLSTKDLRANRMVSVAGAVKFPQEFEWQPHISAKNLVALAGGYLPNHQKGVLLIERLNPGTQQVSIIEVNGEDGLALGSEDPMYLEPGDRIVAPVDPNWYEQELVSLTGAVRNPGRYALTKNRETITEFIGRKAIFDENAFLQGGRLYRQRGESYFLVNFDFEDAVHGSLKRPVTLMHGDSIYVPYEQLTVQIKGEVVSPGDVLWVKGWDIDDYINAAGGLTLTGDEDRIVITYANGRKSNRDRAEMDPDPGSVIEVAYIKPPEPIRWTEVVSAFGTIITGLAAFIIAYATMTGSTN